MRFFSSLSSALCRSIYPPVPGYPGVHGVVVLRTIATAVEGEAMIQYQLFNASRTWVKKGFVSVARTK